MLMFDYIESVDDKTPIVGEQQQMQRKIDYSQVIEGYNECLRIDSDFVLPRIQYGQCICQKWRDREGYRNF